MHTSLPEPGQYREIGSMDEGLRLILCEPEYWTWEPSLNYYVKFNKDGTGELFCIQEFTYLCALNFEWKSIALARPPASTTQARSVGRTRPQVLGTIHLEITLKKGLAKGLHTLDPSSCLRCHEAYLLDTAYRPKFFTITIEMGSFLPASRIGFEEKTSMLRYGFRLLFDLSPFPSLEDWNYRFPNAVPPVGPVDRHQPPMVEFVARKLPESICRGIAMNDTAPALFSGSCVIS